MEESSRQRVCDAGVESRQVTAVTPTNERQQGVLPSMGAEEDTEIQGTLKGPSPNNETGLNASDKSVLDNEENSHLVKEPVESDTSCDLLAAERATGAIEIFADISSKNNSNKCEIHVPSLQSPEIIEKLEEHIFEKSISENVISDKTEESPTDVVSESIGTELDKSNLQTIEVESLSSDKVQPPEDLIELRKGTTEDYGEKEGVEAKESESSPVHSFLEDPREITGAWEEFETPSGECFTKGCKWSPDGTCLLCCADDGVLRLLDLPAQLHCQPRWEAGRRLPELRPALRVREGGLVYDYCWYPLMSSWDPLSCCMVSASQDSPVHLWDAFTGQLRATYRAYNQVDEVEAAQSVAFDPQGSKLYCGFRDCVRIFPTAVPGRDCETRKLKDAGVSDAQRGIVSCICVNPAMSNIYAVGTYLKSIGLYCEPSGSALCLASGHTGGVTHLAFSRDGTKLFSGARKDAEIVCWDIRNPGTVLYVLKRKVSTNQRITFDLTPDDRYLLSGQSDGRVAVWDLTQSPVAEGVGDPVLSPVRTFLAHGDCANGVSVHQQYPLIATSSGQRHFPELSRDSSDSDAESPLLKRRYIQRENCVKLWWAAA